MIDNPKLIADQVEELRLFPKHPEGKDTFQPYWADAADDIQNRAWGRAKELYGDPLPEIVQSGWKRSWAPSWATASPPCTPSLRSW